MELYVLSKEDLSILSVSKLAKYEINLDEETNAKSTFELIQTDGLKKDNFLVLNGLYKQFLFIIDEVQIEKDSNVATVAALDITNIFDRKVIEKDIDTMTTDSIEEFIANTIAENFVNSDDPVLNVSYMDIVWHTNTQGVVATNAENGLYNFHTFITNCRQYKNIYTEISVEFIEDEDTGLCSCKLITDISYKEEDTQLIDTTLPEVTNYNKIYENDVTAKVTVFIREDNSTYNLYLKTDRTTTTNKNDPNRASGKIEVISVDTADMASTEALNVMKGNNYKHLVEFKIAKTSKVMDVTSLNIGKPILIKTADDVYDSYISAITLTDENFVYFKSGSLRTTLLDKLKMTSQTGGNKLDVTGGVINGNIKVKGDIYWNNEKLNTYSTTETVVGTWTDGKPLYRKVISTTNQVANDTSIAHNITNMDFMCIRNVFFNHTNGSVSWLVPIDLYGAVGTTNTDRVGVALTTTHIVFKCDTSWGTYWRKIIVIEYTKTTD